jgi:hypothetical protein
MLYHIFQQITYLYMGWKITNYIYIHNISWNAIVPYHFQTKQKTGTGL